MTIQAMSERARWRPPVTRSDAPENRRRGGDIRVLLSPTTVGATAGFLGTLQLAAGEYVSEHWHPYSEEFLYCVSGAVTVSLDGEPIAVGAEQALHIPIGVRHRITNDGGQPASFVFYLGPLAPRPDLGHVDTEALPSTTPSTQPRLTPGTG
jgi:putative monooxygenase